MMKETTKEIMFNQAVEIVSNNLDYRSPQFTDEIRKCYVAILKAREAIL